MKRIVVLGAGESGTGAAILAKEKGMDVAVMKPIIDTKAGDKLQTRIGIERDVDYLIKKDECKFNR